MTPLIAAPDGPDVAYLGDFPDYTAAKAVSTGYDELVILERTRHALHKVLRGEAAYERDSVTFDKLELPFPLLSILLRIAAEHQGHLSVLDFGGSLGSTFFQCRDFLGGLSSLEWSIIELPGHVACGQKEFANNVLKFFPTIDVCLKQRSPQVLLLSSVLPYLPDPWRFISEVTSAGFEWIVLDRTAFIDADRDRLTVEVVSPRIYPASYPAWFFSKSYFEQHFPAGWEKIVQFDALDRQLLDGKELIFQGMAFKRKS